MQNEKGSFTNSLGFVMAAAGSAVGLGNIWRLESYKISILIFFEDAFTLFYRILISTFNIKIW